MDVGWGGRIRTFNLLIQSNLRYLRSRFRIGPLCLICELRGGAASEPGTQIRSENAQIASNLAVSVSIRSSCVQARHYRVRARENRLRRVSEVALDSPNIAEEVTTPAEYGVEDIAKFLRWS